MISAKTFERYAIDPSAFRDDLLIDVSGSVRRLGNSMDDWQGADFAALDAGLARCNGRSDRPARLRAYLERPRGHSKTTDLAVMVCWVLAFSTRPLRGYGFAADKDQARLLKDAVSTVLRLNPWLAKILTVEAGRVVVSAKSHPGAGGSLSIEASDVGSSYGILPDFVICDELTHWEGDGALWHSIISSAAKRENCLLVVIANAGFVDSWSWSVREAARTDEAWVFSRLDGPRASWMTEKRLEEQRRMLPAVAFRRLWLNEWSTGGGDALTPEDIASAFQSDLQPMTGVEKGWTFVGGIDLGVSRDASAVVVLASGQHGTPQQGRIRLAHAHLWKPTPGKRVDLMEVERYVRALDRKFALRRIGFDPWQAEHLAQRLEADAGHRRRQQHLPARVEPWMKEIPPSGANLRDMASLVLESFTDRRFQFFPCAPLHADLLKLRVEERPYGYRLVSPRDGDGHGDTFSAFALALLIAHQEAGKRKVVIGALDGQGRRQGDSRLEQEFLRIEAENVLRRQIAADSGSPDYAGMHEWRLLMRSVGRT
ncbi:Phage Terminase [Caulifigura coniformis]|uniref:Phage Terminase n=1 Tax=Caulifigura coniformis TaxID=2527983 RepID=A0A517SJI6_9PLAN|nr:terminase large subunit [Caulifigura coniformis]QDT56277.1 Phage Terminase [Caulifigura coniformis]